MPTINRTIRRYTTNAVFSMFFTNVDSVLTILGFSGFTEKGVQPAHTNIYIYIYLFIEGSARHGFRPRL